MVASMRAKTQQQDIYQRRGARVLSRVRERELERERERERQREREIERKRKTERDKEREEKIGERRVADGTFFLPMQTRKRGQPFSLKQKKCFAVVLSLIFLIV
jgi:hypothetical protein